MTTQFLPYIKPDAGSQIGVSYIGEFIKCPRKWYNKYARLTRNSDGSVSATGIEVHQTASPLISGSLFHHALENYYKSGCLSGEDTGAYSLEFALSKLEDEFNLRKSQYETEDAAESEYAMVRSMILSYDERYGPNGGDPDYPAIKILCDQDTGEPYLERNFATPLGYKDYYLTCKVDAVINDQGFVKVFEHKTSVASYVNTRVSSIHTDAQFAGEILTLNENIKTGDPLAGVKVNVVVKNRAAKSKFDVAVRETTSRSPSQLEDFKACAVDVLTQIDERMEQMVDWVEAKGVDAEKAAGVWFPSRGQFNGECQAYRRNCDFLMLCKQPDRAKQLLNGYRPRVKVIEQEESVES